MKALLVVAHGSRRKESNEEIAALAAKVAERAAGGEFGIVEYAFLELAEPSIPDGIETCLQQGASSVSVLPYFLARGTHVVEDIPEQVAIKQKEHPDSDIHITPYLGTVEDLPDVLLKLAT